MKYVKYTTFKALRKDLNSRGDLPAARTEKLSNAAQAKSFNKNFI